MGNTALTVNAPDLVAAIEAEMDRAWAEAHADDGYTQEQAEADLLARHPLFATAADGTLIEVLALATDGEPIDDELVAVAAVVLERRLREAAA